MAEFYKYIRLKNPDEFTVTFNLQEWKYTGIKKNITELFPEQSTGLIGSSHLITFFLILSLIFTFRRKLTN
jgi:hypothetical protein